MSRINNYTVCRDFAVLELTDKNGNVKGVTKISLCDVERVAQHGRWALTPQGYAYKGYTALHRFITDCPDGLVVDHINRDRLDNRRCNLRNVTQSVNMQNVAPRKKGMRRTPCAATKPYNIGIRLSEEAVLILDSVGKRFGLKKTATIEYILREYARSNGYELSAKTAHTPNDLNETTEGK